MKHLALFILAFAALALGAQTWGVNAGATTSGGVVMSSGTACAPAPAPMGPMVGRRIVHGHGLVATGGVCAPRPVVVHHSRIMAGGCYRVKGHRRFRNAPAMCAVPARRCGDAGFYYGYRNCR